MVFSIYPLVAQLVEQLPFKERVAGSIPAERTIKFIVFKTSFPCGCSSGLFQDIPHCPSVLFFLNQFCVN